MKLRTSFKASRIISEAMAHECSHEEGPIITRSDTQSSRIQKHSGFILFDSHQSLSTQLLLQATTRHRMVISVMMNRTWVPPARQCTSTDKMSSFMRAWDDIKILKPLAQQPFLVLQFWVALAHNEWAQQGPPRSKAHGPAEGLGKDILLDATTCMYIYTEEFLMEQKSQGKFKPTFRCGL